MTASLTLYDSYTRTLRPFAPIEPGKVGIYSCGPTVYNYAHVGNLRAYIFTDTLSRVLAWKGYKPNHIINITDVGHLTSDADAGDDKMEAAAKASGRDIWDISRHYTDAFKQNLKDLNIREPARFPLATDHIAGMIAFGEAIADKHCYLLDSGLYFDVSTVPDYGRLARSQDDAGESRIDPVDGKRNAADFAIWRTSPPGENRQMEWDSPWGRGAPGWHLECSVMSRQYLGDRFDIHTGGIDHREIHHPNEIAQNQAHCGCADTGASFWMHNNFLVDRTGKMSKSSGEFLTLQALVDRGFHPLAYRMLCLQAHYRSELEFSWENLAAASVRLKRLVIAITNVKKKATASHWPPFLTYYANPTIMGHHSDTINTSDKWMDFTGVLQDFDQSVSADLNTPAALPLTELALVEEAISDAHILPDNRLRLVATMDEVFGLALLSLTRADLRVRPATATIDEPTIEARLTERREARAAKDFARSDAIRDDLVAAGVEVMDGDPLGWDWKPVSA